MPLDSPRDGSPELAHRLRILVIDDEAGVREILGELLSEEGHAVTLAASGGEGLARFGEAPFDLVITDLAMPKVTGLEVAREIRRRDSRAVCILTSGWPDQRSRDGLDSSVADIVLTKPFHLDEVLAAVDRGARLRRTRLAAPPSGGVPPLGGTP
ncbi:MAG: response regulator [bacterium]